MTGIITDLYNKIIFSKKEVITFENDLPYFIKQTSSNLHFIYLLLIKKNVTILETFGF